MIAGQGWLDGMCPVERRNGAGGSPSITNLDLDWRQLRSYWVAPLKPRSWSSAGDNVEAKDALISPRLRKLFSSLFLVGVSKLHSLASTNSLAVIANGFFFLVTIQFARLFGA